MDSKNARSVRRPVIATAILLVAVAVLLVFLRSWFEGRAEESAPAPSVATEPERIDPISETSIPTELPEAVMPATNDSAAVALAPIVEPVEPVRVIVLPARVGTPGPAAEFFVDSVRQAMLRALRGMSSVEVVDVSVAELAAVVPPNAGSLGEDRLVYLAVSRQYDGSIVAEISEQSPPDSPNWTITLQVRRLSGPSSSGSSVSKNGDPRRGNDPESLGVRYAESIAQRVEQNAFALPTSSPGAGDARSVLLDPTRAENERLQSLSQLRTESLDSETLAAAVDLALRSVSAETRQRVWMLLRQSAYEPTLAQSMSYALLSDEDAAVRKEAALGLAAYLGDGGTLPALEHALRNDSSAEVRLAARMSTLDYDEQQAFKRETLLDRNLTPAERLAPTTIAGGARPAPFLSPYGAAEAEDARAYAEIVAATDDPELKLRGLSELQRTMMMRMPARVGGQDIDPEITRVVIESVAVEDDRVRRQALRVLQQQAANPEARAVLETVLKNEPELAAELRIAEALERAPPGTPAPGR